MVAIREHIRGQRSEDPQKIIKFYNRISANADVLLGDRPARTIRAKDLDLQPFYAYSRNPIGHFSKNEPISFDVSRDFDLRTIDLVILGPSGEGLKIHMNGSNVSISKKDACDKDGKTAGWASFEAPHFKTNLGRINCADFFFRALLVQVVKPR